MKLLHFRSKKSWIQSVIRPQKQLRKRLCIEIIKGKYNDNLIPDQHKLAYIEDEYTDSTTTTIAAKKERKSSNKINSNKKQTTTSQNLGQN